MTGDGLWRWEMEIEAFLELVRSRRHNGRVKADPVPDEAIRKILEAACWAPSGNNSQPWEFVVVKSQESKAKMREIMEGPGSARHGGPQEATVDPPAVILVCGDFRLMESYPETVNREEVFYSSLAAAIQNMHLAATTLGLATSWGTVKKTEMSRLHELVNLPGTLEIVALIRLGYPQEVPPPKARRPFEEAIHFEKYDRTRQRDVKRFIETYGKGWGRL
jgi:nitroreductase